MTASKVQYARGWRKRRRITMLEYPEQKRTVLTTPVEQPKKREWVGLTDEDISTLDVRYHHDNWRLIKEVEAKLKEKNFL